MRGKLWLGSALAIAAAVAAAPLLASAATLWVNGQQCGTFVKDPNAGTVTINCPMLTQPTPQPTTSGQQPTPTPQIAPTPTPIVNNGSCPTGYTLLNTNMSFASNTFGLDFQTVLAGQTTHFCAVLPDSVDTTRMTVATADRTGPAQCSRVTLTVTPPADSGLNVKTSTATNNTIRINGLTPPSYFVPTGTYLIDITGNASFGNCVSSSTYMVYWQYQ